MLLVHVPPDQFNWPCANVLTGSGDPYSTAGAEGFISAAIDKKIDVCTKVKYISGSRDMQAAIEEIMSTKCCRVTVVFGQAQDLASLFLEAHKQRYDGEWVVGDNLIAAVDDIVADLKKHLDDDSAHKLLRGVYGKEVSQ